MPSCRKGSCITFYTYAIIKSKKWMLRNISSLKSLHAIVSLKLMYLFFSLLFIYSSKQHDTAVFILARGWCWTELHDSRANNEILFVSTIVYWYFTFSIITFSIYKTMDIIWTIQASTSQLKHLTWSHEAHYSFFSDVVKKPGYRGLLQWVRSIVNRFWWRCSRCKGNVNRLLKRWISILHHIQRKVFGQVDVKYCFEFILM